MKLLFDENLSHRLPAQLGDLFPGAQHLRDVGLKGSSDATIWTYAKEQGSIIVSKDADFYDRAVLFRSPPKVIFLRMGNGGTSQIEQLLRQSHLLIHAFNESVEGDCLLLPANELSDPSPDPVKLEP